MARKFRLTFLVGALIAFLSACGYDVLQAHESVVLRGATHDVATLNGGSSDFILLDSDRSDDQEIDGVSFIKPDGSYDGSSNPEYPLTPYAPFGFMFDADGDGEPEFIVDTRDRENVKILRPDGGEEAKAGTGEDGSVSGVDSDGDGTTDVAVPTPPGVPTGVSASPLDGGASVSFTLPADNGGLPVSDVQVRVDGEGDWVSIGLTSPGSVTGLSNGTEVSLEVRAVNARGGGTPADPVKVTPSADAGATPDAGDGGDGEPAPVAVTGVSIDAAPQRVFDGLTASLSAVVSPADAADRGVTWSVDDPAVATIDAQSGVLTGITPGATVTVTVTTDDGGYTDSAQLVVDNRALVYEATWAGTTGDEDEFTFITSSQGPVEVQIRDTAGQLLSPASCVDDGLPVVLASSVVRQQNAGDLIPQSDDLDSRSIYGANNQDSFALDPNVIFIDDTFVDTCLGDASYAQGDAYRLFVYDTGITELGTPQLQSDLYAAEITKVVSWGDTSLTALNAFGTRDPNSFSRLTTVPEYLPSTVTALRGTFARTDGVTGFETWDVSKVEVFRGVFADAKNVGGLSSWDVSSAITMEHMFHNSPFDSSDVSSWAVGNVQSFAYMFANGDFNQPLLWDTSSAVSMRAMFRSNDSFAQDINNWNVSSLKDAEDFLANADAFISDLDQWQLTSVENLRGFMDNAENYTGNLSWTLPTDATIELDISEFFEITSSNNPTGVESWDVSRVVTADNFLRDATAFDADLSNWDTSALTNCNDAFDGASLDSAKRFDTNSCTP